MEDNRNLQKPLDRKKMHIGCLTCSPVTHVLEMNRLIAVGFGDAGCTKDGKTVYSECQDKDGEFRYANEFEEMAAKDPNHDWRIYFYAPLHEEVYQRQDKGWVMISSGNGFA